MLDYGVMLDHEPGFPMHVPPKELDAVILTHSHLDHSGAIPIFYINDKKPLYTNKLNLELTQVLIQDFIHLSSYYLPFEYLELNTMMHNSKHIDFGVEETIGDMKVKLFDAGHTPGSAQVLIEADGKKILYHRRLQHGRQQNAQGRNYGLRRFRCCYHRKHLRK